MMLAPNYSASSRAHLKWTPPSDNPPSEPPLADSAPPHQASSSDQPSLPEASPSPLPFSPYFHAHEILNIYKTAHSDLVLGPSATSPLCYISTHAHTRPHITLHRTSNRQSAPLATAEFRHFSSSTTIVATPHPDGPSAGPFREELDKARSGVFAISIPVPATRGRERFEWRRSDAPAVQLLQARRVGWEFVRASTAEVLAVYAGVAGWSSKKVGKVMWLGEYSGTGGAGAELGDGGRVLALMSLLMVLERERRGKGTHRKGGMAAVFGAGAGGAVGGAGIS